MTVKINNILKKADLRHTKVRESVLDIMLKSEHAVTSGDIDNAFVDMDRITLYRTLKTFEEKGIIHKILDQSGSSKYAMCAADCSEHHHHDSHLHFHCEACGNTFCLDDTSTPEVNLPAGYKPKTTSVVVSGICDKC